MKHDWLAHVDVFKPYNECFRVARLDQIVAHFYDHIWVLIGIELSKVKIDAILFQKGNMIHDVLGFIGVVCHGEGHQEGRCPILISWPLHDRRALDVELAAQHISPIVITGNRLLFSRPGRRRRTGRVQLSVYPSFV